MTEQLCNQAQCHHIRKTSTGYWRCVLSDHLFHPDHHYMVKISRAATYAS